MEWGEMVVLFELRARFGVERVVILYVGGKERESYNGIGCDESRAGIELWNDGMLLDD